MKQVFVSYSSVDRELVAPLVADLESAGYDVWFDQELSGGQAWWDEIIRRITVADAVVMAATEHAVVSAACGAETEYAMDLAKTIIPVRLTALGPIDAPTWLQKLQWVDYRQPGQAATLRLVKAVNTAQSPPVPDPLPAPPAIPLSYLAASIDMVDRPDALTKDEQASLLLALREAGDRPDDVAHVLVLARRFRQRDDLLTSLTPDVQQLIGELETKATPPEIPRPVPTPQIPGNGGRSDPHTRRWIVLGVVAAIAVVALAGLLAWANRGDDGANRGNRGEPVTVTVPGTQAVTNTGIDLDPGQAYQVTATGTVLHANDPATAVGPDGDPNPELVQFNVLVGGVPLDAPHSALIGKVGDTGTPFLVGASAELTAPESGGRLFLGVNDVGVGNNSGEFTAVVTVG